MVDSTTIPHEEIPALLSALQISLSSRPFDRSLQAVRILLGKPNKRELVSVSRIKWGAKVSQALMTSVNFTEASPRAREIYSSMFENYFVVLQRNPEAMDHTRLGRFDTVFARHLAYALLKYNLFRFLSGDRSAKTKESVLQYLALVSSAGSVSACAASLSIYQLLGVRMTRPLFYSVGSAMALLGDDVTLSWYEYEPLPIVQAQVKKGRFQSSQKRVDDEQTRVAAHVLLEQDVSTVDVDHQNTDGDTLPHIAMRSGNTSLVFSLVRDHGASAAARNKLGEEPIHQLHRLEPRFVEGIAMLLLEAGANIEASAPARLGDFDGTVASMTAGRLLPTLLLRAIQARNVAAVAALVDLQADVGSGPGSRYDSFELCPVAVAAAMLEHECLDLLLPAWQPNPADDPDQSETRYLWELAIAGFDRIDLVKFHGDLYNLRIRHTIKTLTEHIWPCYLVRSQRSSLDYVADGGDLAWVEEILETHHGDPARAIPAELQLGLGRAISRGHREIARKFTSFGALPLLPVRWATSRFAAGRPGPWSPNLVARLNKETQEAGGSVYETQCCLHFCATAGTESIHVAADILADPVPSSRLKPDLSKPTSPMLDMYGPAENAWTLPRLDRPDEDGDTPLYTAQYQGEFALAQLFVQHGASWHGRGWSIPGRLFEEGSPMLVSQLEFMLTKGGASGRSTLTRRVFDRLHAQPHDMLEKEREMIRWPTEVQTIPTAIADICARLEDTDKRRLWSLVLPLFTDTASPLARTPGTGKNALSDYYREC